MMLDSGASYRGEKIPGRGNEKYKKHFVSGVAVASDVELSIKAKDVRGVWINAHSDGNPRGNRRVTRCIPTMDAGLEFEAIYHVFDELVTEDVFEATLRDAGIFIGIGQNRIENGGTRGRLEVLSIDWQDGCVLANGNGKPKRRK
jgi:hypothetical protein